MRASEPVLIWTGAAMLDGVLTIAHSAEGLIVIPGLGGTFHHEAMRSAAAVLNGKQFATLICDLLTADEQQFDQRTGHFRVDTAFLAGRLRDVVKWARREKELRELPIGFFATHATAAAAIEAVRTAEIFAVVAAGATLDAVRGHLEGLQTPALLIVDRKLSSAQLRHLADASFRGTVATVEGSAALIENHAAMHHAVQMAAAWFHESVPLLASV